MASFKRGIGFFVLGSTMLTGRGQTAAQQAESAGPRLPFEEVGACPFEGCVYRDWIANSPVAIRADRRPDAPIVFSLEKGDRVQAITGIVVTLKPGRVQFRETADGLVDSASQHESDDGLDERTRKIRQQGSFRLVLGDVALLELFPCGDCQRFRRYQISDFSRTAGAII